MDDATMRELRMLRVRAYGPSPDIAGDPVALARLSELEAWMLPTPPDDPPLEALPEPEPAEPTDAAAEEAPPLPVIPSTERVNRRTKMLWAASVLAALVVGAGLTYGFSAVSSVSRGGGGVQIATLRAVPDAEVPPFLSTQFDEVVVFDEFEGITVIASDRGWIGNGGDCIFVVLTEEFDTDADFFEGSMYPGCGAGGFPATVQLVVDENMPEALGARLPEGSAVQFVLDGDRVGVFTEAE